MQMNIYNRLIIKFEMKSQKIAIGRTTASSEV